MKSLSRSLTVLPLLGLALASGACGTMTPSAFPSETTTVNDQPAASPGSVTPSTPESIQAP